MALFDLYQHHRIRQTAKRVTMAEENGHRQFQRNQDDIDELHGRIDRLVLVNHALWELLAAATGLDGAALTAKLVEIDERDGRVDGRHQGVAAECACGAKVGPRVVNCQFCGAPAPQRSLFDTL
ncbi:MAG: hypothetical protein ACFCVK_00240 [Acidimicrobiales bacterium]